jgi:glycosyltransferase involved in cell wall biosynthesis
MHRYRTSRVTILASSLFTEGGDWRSIYFFAKQLESRGEKVAMVHVGGKRGFRQACAAGVYAPKLLVNGLGTLARWHVLMICLMRKDVRIYLHETGYILDQFQRQSPLRYRFVSKILRHNPVLCVSKQAEAHYRERFGSTHTHVVYECPGDVEPLPLDQSKTHIVMVGSINERKGVELFSQVADLASEAHPDWQFHWIGSKATTSQLYQSPKVLWHGWQWNPRDIVGKCDVFFLSSIDDPCPLAALEALHMGIRCVAFHGTGTAELIHGIPGCEVFSDYNQNDAFVALKKSIAAAELPTTISDLILDRTGPATFQQAMTNAMDTRS